MSLPDIRLARPADLESINEIYNHYVNRSTATYQEQPETIDERKKWFFAHDEMHPVTVAEFDGQIIGWGAISRFRPRSAYRYTAEDTIYIHHYWLRRGIGSSLLHDLISRARAGGHHAIIAGIDAEQPGSVALHSRFGFTEAGRLKQVGYKFGRWLDVIYMELLL